MASSKRSKGSRPKSSSSRKVAPLAAVSRNAETVARGPIVSSFVEPALAPLCQLAAKMNVAPAAKPVIETGTSPQESAPVSETHAATQESAPVSETHAATQESAPVSERRAVQAAQPVKGVSSTEERRRLVAQLAYQRAENMGFGRTNPVEDWLWAEQEVQRRMQSRAA